MRLVPGERFQTLRHGERPPHPAGDRRRRARARAAVMEGGNPCAEQSERVARVLVAPGNAGTAREPGIENVPVGAEDIEGLVALARERSVDLTVVGPEAPLVAGIADRFDSEGLRIFGPSAAAARLEGSKAFTKAFLAHHGIPTARYVEFTDPVEAIAHVREHGVPIVVKADGLAAGKGVVVARSEEEALVAVDSMLSGRAFGAAGRRIVIEEFLAGEEASFICMVGGGEAVPLASSQDHKAAGEGDTGPNTGGMGAYSPAPVVDAAAHERIMREIVRPTVEGMAARGTPYTGFLYAGLMIDDTGAPRVIEFNCRLGDPETQPILLRLRSDLVDLIDACHRRGARARAARVGRTRGARGGDGGGRLSRKLRQGAPDHRTRCRHGSHQGLPRRHGRRRWPCGDLGRPGAVRVRSREGRERGAAQSVGADRGRGLGWRLAPARHRTSRGGPPNGTGTCTSAVCAKTARRNSKPLSASALQNAGRVKFDHFGSSTWMYRNVKIRSTAFSGNNS